MMLLFGLEFEDIFWILTLSKIYKCRYTSCDETFHRKLDLSLHVKTEHRKSPKKNKKTQVLYYDDDGIQIYKCRYCSEGFRIQQAMHSLVSPFPWNYCNAHFSRAMPLLAVHEIFYYSEHIYKSDFRLHLKKV
jgi:hypothetical protein